MTFCMCLRFPSCNFPIGFEEVLVRCLLYFCILCIIVCTVGGYYRPTFANLICNLIIVCSTSMTVSFV